MTTALVCSFGGGVFVRISSCNEFGCCAKLPGPNSWRRVGVSARCGQPVCSLQTSLRGFPEARDGAGNGSSESEVHTGKGVRSRELPHIQTLRELPREELFAKVVLVRFDSTILLQDEIKSGDESVYDAVFTIRYLHEAGAKVVLVSDWSSKVNPKVTSAQSVAGILSSILRLKVSPTQSSFSYTPSSVKRYDDVEVVLLENLHKCKGELANFYEFSQQLSAGVDIFVNDAFSQSHKILASTVGITGSCYASVAGFHFEESLNKLKKAAISNCRPYFAIIGGDNFLNKSDALHCLASECDGLVFVGMMSFQVMHALGFHVPPSLVDHNSLEEVKILVQTASSRRIPIICPKDFWCVSSHHPQQLGLVRDHELFEDLIPIDIGPESLEKINTLLIKCEKLLWIGPVRFKQPTRDVRGTTKLVYMLDQLFQQKCDVTVVGSESCKAVVEESVCASLYRMFENATVVWEYLAGRKLPAVMALDRAWSSEIDWQTIYADAVHPLVVDIGSGNGKFLFGMAENRKDFNFLGLENNERLVPRCLHSVHQSRMKNIHFIAANATSTFRSIISSYPGDLILVTISCPNPDFNKPEHRWRMLQRSLVEAVADLLNPGGKVFLQSDIEDVALRMRGQFLEYGNGKLIPVGNQDEATGHGEWLKENPFGVHSDWEQHVMDRGDPMYRLMLYKPEESTPSVQPEVHDAFKF
uniref:Phosphoglycerate kinase n=1 Tax=Kalanchoe fedtschenkoi TaxID=63787 RepID=A0A7N0TGX9_KALFE